MVLTKPEITTLVVIKTNNNYRKSGLVQCFKNLEKGFNENGTAIDVVFLCLYVCFVAIGEKKPKHVFKVYYLIPAFELAHSCLSVDSQLSYGSSASRISFLLPISRC